MSPSDDVMGFTNKWYREGIEHKISVSLEYGDTIYILTSAYYLATKMEALKNRGLPDFRYSHDFEDMIYVLDNCSTVLEDINKASNKMKHYLKDEFIALYDKNIFKEAVEVNVPLGQAGRSKLIIEKIESILKI